MSSTLHLEHKLMFIMVLKLVLLEDRVKFKISLMMGMMDHSHLLQIRQAMIQIWMLFNLIVVLVPIKIE